MLTFPFFNPRLPVQEINRSTFHLDSYSETTRNPMAATCRTLFATFLVMLLISGLGVASTQAQTPISTIKDNQGNALMTIYKSGNLALGLTGPKARLHAQNTGGNGLATPTLRAENLSASDGIAGYFKTSGTDATVVLENLDAGGPLLKGFGQDGGNREITIQNSGSVGLFGPDGRTVSLDAHNSSLLLSGERVTDGTESDSIPTEGLGTRMMWYPEKAAFRVGQLDGSCCNDYWNASNVGIHSVALGRNTEASGEQSTAMGELTVASGNDATAMGFSTNASGLSATAMGSGTTASGDYATTMGNNVVAETNWSFSFGQCNVANNTASVGETLLVAGNGSVGSFGTCLSNSDAMVLDRNGNLEISGSLTENSDRRLKSSIKPLGKGVLAALQQIRPVRFHFKNESTHPSGEQIGLIAQDVRKEFPALVSKGSEGYLSLAYPKMTALLLKGLQEQQSVIERQKAQLDSLQSRVQQIENMRNRLSKLEAAQTSGDSVLASLPGVGLLLALLAGGVLGAGLVQRRS